MAEDWRARIYQTYNLIGSWINQPEVLMPIDEGGPGPQPMPLLVGAPDADGLTGLRVVDALIAAEGPSVPIAGRLPGEPGSAVVVIPTKFQTPESLALMPEGEAKEKAGLSLAASEIHKNAVQRYQPAPFYKPWLKWVDSDKVPDALSSNKGAAWLGQAVVGRARGIKNGTAQATFLWLTDRDFAAGA